jgi:hypothetical protein
MGLIVDVAVRGLGIEAGLTLALFYKVANDMLMRGTS